MTPSKTIILGIALGSALIAAPITWADSGPRCSGGKGHMISRHGGHGHGSATGHLLRHLLKNKQEIGVSDEQIAKLRAKRELVGVLTSEQRTKLKALWEQHRQQ